MCVKSKSIKSISIILVLTLCITMSFALVPENISHAASISQVKNLSVKMTNAKVQMSWSKAYGAKKYQIYRATSSRGTYKYVATTYKNYYVGNCDFGYYCYKVRGVNSSGSVKGAFSSYKSFYGVLGASQLYRASYVGSTMIRVLINNGSTRHNMYMMGKKSTNVVYSWYIAIKSKTTKQTVKTYRAVHCNQYASVATKSVIPKKTAGYVFCETIVGTMIPSKYLDTSKYYIVVKAPFALSSNINSGQAFYVYCPTTYAGSDSVRFR